MKIAYLLDTGSSYNIGLEPDCFFVPMIIDVVDKHSTQSYKDQIDITNDELNKILNSKKIIRTSQPTIGSIMEKANEIFQQYEKIITIPFSSVLSSTYSTFLNLQKEYGKEKFLVADANTMSITGNWLVSDLKKYIESNGDINQDELDNITRRIRQSQCGSLIISDSSYLISGGRISGFKGLIVKTLKLKLIIKFHGGLEFANKSNNFFNAIDKSLEIIDLVTEFRKYGIKRYTIMTSLEDEEENDKNIRYIKSILGNEDKCYISELPGCVQCHTGPNNFSILIESYKEPD
ncbi:MAG: DegV family EDD domain-containing protein [Ureaplasma sp.]|nr:DegV family EDD domain-containing protein [Ureaplasma sp.]MDE7221891.1 DegV family EDD domain-containing protein [Ureaplasma sp.]